MRSYDSASTDRDASQNGDIRTNLHVIFYGDRCRALSLLKHRNFQIGILMIRSPEGYIVCNHHIVPDPEITCQPKYHSAINATAVANRKSPTLTNTDSRIECDRPPNIYAEKTAK